MKRILLFMSLIALLINVYAHPKVDLSGAVMPNYSSRADSLHGFDVISYYIDIEIDDRNQYISGWVEAVVIAQDDLTNVEYNLVGLDVSSVEVDGQLATYSYENDLITIPVNVENNQQFTTKVSYSGNPQLSTDGYNIGMIFRPNMVFTLSDPNATRNWFPCYDHPWDKAIVSFNVTCRDDWVAACNGLQGSTVDNGDGTKSYEWLGESPMATFLAVIHIAPYQLIEQTFTKTSGEVIPIQHFVQSSHYNDCLVNFARVPEMMQVYTDAYGEYQFEKYGQALVNMQTYGAMEHQTMTTLGVSYINGNPDDPQYTVAHELSHHWFGNCLTPLTWKDVWLSEGFAVYSEAVWANHLFGYEAMIDYVNTSIQNYYKSWQGSNGPKVIYDPAYLSYFTPPSYEKAASVLHMLRLELGNELYWPTIQSWYANNINGNVITEEFRAHCEEVSGLDLEQFFHQWIYSAGIPSYEYALLRNQTTNQIKFYNNVTSETETDFYLTIPFFVGEASDSLRTQFSPGFSKTSPLTITNIDAPITVDPDNWNLIKVRKELILEMQNVFAGSNQAILSWTRFADETDFVGYNIYQKKLTENEWNLVNQEPIQENNYTVVGLENGEAYHFYVVLADAEGFETYPTDSLEMIVTPNVITPLQSILIVDDSADGAGVLLNPTDEEVDNFYNNLVFGGYEVANIDLNQEELTADVISNYEVIIWHNETVATSSLSEYETLLGNYLLSGGKLILSGWKTVLDISPGFLEHFLGVTSHQVLVAPVLNNAVHTHSLYSDLTPNGSLLPDIWNGSLSMVTTFTNSENSLYTLEDLETVVAVYSTSSNIWESYFFGFPLYYIQPEQVRSVLLSMLVNTTPPVENENNVETVPQPLVLYPNPVRDVINIKSDAKGDELINISLYNIKGQKVLSREQQEMKNGALKFSLKEKKLANGIYFVRIYNENRSEIKKLMILK